MSEENLAVNSEQLVVNREGHRADIARHSYGAITSIENGDCDNVPHGENYIQAIGNERRISSESSSSSSPSPDQMKSTLSFLQKIGFGLGHIYNDLCAGVWFSYTLLFMQAALLIPAPEAGALVMLGQVIDAISTPIVGLLADRYGTKRQWHIVGTGLVFISFPMIFSLCPWCNTSAPHWWPPVYFAIFIILFQFAWAMVQITHLSMIPEMSITLKDRADLTATRYSASVISNVIVYIVTWTLLHSHNKFDTNIGPLDAYRFRDISLILTLIGLTMSVLFHFSLSMSGYERRRLLALTHHNSNGEHKHNGTENPPDNQNPVPSETDTLISNSQSSGSIGRNQEINAQPRKNFLRSPLLYINALLYVFSRLFMTTSLVYMPLWLDERSWQPPKPQPTSPPGGNITLPPAITGDIGVDHLATVPLVSFLASFVASLLLKHLYRWIGNQTAYLIGSIICVAGCVWIAIAAPNDFAPLKLFNVAILFGAGSSITMISSLCITAHMIGRHTYQGGFIYSAVTFADKLITGVVVVIIETIKCKKREECPEYYRNVLAYGCGIAAVLGVVTLFILKCAGRRPL